MQDTQQPQTTAQTSSQSSKQTPEQQDTAILRDIFLSMPDEKKWESHFTALNRIITANERVRVAKSYHEVTMAQLRAAFDKVMRDAILIPGVPLDAVREARDFERALKTL